MFGRTSGHDFSCNFCRKLQFFKVSRSFECLIFPGLTTIRLKSRQKSRKIKMRSNAPKVKRNETMTLSDRKHFAAMIRSWAKYREVLQEHLRIFKKTIFRGFTKSRFDLGSEPIFVTLSNTVVGETLTGQTLTGFGIFHEIFKINFDLLNKI